jgi:lysine 6-dehydrogenase
MKTIVLGTGLVGGTIARDLAIDMEITAVDISQANLDRLGNEPNVTVLEADLSDSSVISRLVADYDLVIGSLPGSMGFRTLRTAVQAGKNVVDISFFPEDGFELDRLAKEKGVVAVIDCGVAPGCSNLILGRMTTVLDETERFECYVGGLPRVRTWPYEYKAPFSPSDVIEEYTRPARMVENGRIVTKPALSEVELLDFPGVGTLEAFNTDGLRTLARTMQVPFMREKTMRYPGHAERMRILRETGFFEKEPVTIKGAAVRPLDLTSQLLFSMWRLGEGEEDFTAMRIVVDGRKSGRRRHFVFDLLDTYDRELRTTSMARTTGYTCTTVARLLAEGKLRRTGICPLEFVGQDEKSYRYVMDGLKKKGIVFKETVTEVN